MLLNLNNLQKKKNKKSNKTVNFMKMINYLLCNGKKIKATNIFIKVLQNLKQANIAFFQVIYKIMPLVELKNLKIGSTNYLIPAQLNESRQFFLAIKSLLLAAIKNKNFFKIEKKIFNEMIDINHSRGEVYKTTKTATINLEKNLQNSRFSKLFLLSKK